MQALYEQMMVELPFAPFFLRKLTTSGRGWVDAHHLSSLDRELYHHLLWLKQYDGSIEELELDFTTTINQLGQSQVCRIAAPGGDGDPASLQVVPLKPGGEVIPVTRANRIEYIHRLAHHQLNTQLNAQFQAFRQGLQSVIPVQWLTLFNQHELQVLISGAEVAIDVEDLRSNTKYSGEHPPPHSLTHSLTPLCFR